MSNWDTAAAQNTAHPGGKKDACTRVSGSAKNLTSPKQRILSPSICGGQHFVYVVFVFVFPVNPLRVALLH